MDVSHNTSTTTRQQLEYLKNKRKKSQISNKMHILESFVSESFFKADAQPITEQNMLELREAFSVFDLNQDGYISKEELSTAMANFGHLVTKAEIDEMVNLVDKDGNGLIDFKEFLALMDSNVLVQNIDQEMTNLFAYIDKNNDGFISEKELKEMLKGMGEKVKKKDIKKMMKLADQNKDGKISFTEFKRMVANGNFLGSAK